MLLKARWIVPITTTPIENGWIRIDGGIITEIGTNSVGARSSRPGGETPPLHDLGDAAIFPGLINAHAHLEFGRCDHPRNSFTAWVRSVQVAQTRQGEIRTKNLRRMIETGTTTIVNHTNVSPSPHLPISPSPHIIHVCEIVGSSPERAAESYRDACKNRLEWLRGGVKHASPLRIDDAVVSPTSLYAVSPIVWEQFLSHRDSVGAPLGAPHLRAGQASPLLSIHIKESAEEDQLYRKGSGPLAQLVKERGGMVWCSDPIAWLKDKELLCKKTLLVHGNYLSKNDMELLQGTEASIIHCPGSHNYFGHQRLPLEEITNNDINVALGTDSLASNEDLSMLTEMQLLQQNYPDLSSETIITMATLNGARALGEEVYCGSLEPGKCADMIAVSVDANDTPWEALLKVDKVEMTMVQGEIVYHSWDI